MAYATVVDVLNRNAARGTYTGTSIPNATQVVEYILEAAAQLDQWLYAGGYAAPFDQAIASGVVGTSAMYLLKRWNTTGAALTVEQTAQNPINLESFQKSWDEIKRVILDRTIDVPLPANPAKSRPRAPGVPGSTGDVNPPQFTFSRTPQPTKHSWDL